MGYKKLDMIYKIVIFFACLLIGIFSLIKLLLNKKFIPKYYIPTFLTILTSVLFLAFIYKEPYRFRKADVFTFSVLHKNRTDKGLIDVSKPPYTDIKKTLGGENKDFFQVAYLEPRLPLFQILYYKDEMIEANTYVIDKDTLYIEYDHKKNKVLKSRYKNNPINLKKAYQLLENQNLFKGKFYNTDISKLD